MKTLNSKELISIKNLTIKIWKRIILQDVSLKINVGDMILLTGGNGTGKTTLLKYIVGVFHSRKIKKAKNIKVSMTPQTVAFKGAVGTLIEKYATMLNKFEMIHKIVDDFSLKNIYEKDFQNISSGEQQRVKLAIAFLRKPDLIILDEFSRGLDPNAVQNFINLINNLMKKYQIAIVIVSHNTSVIKALSSKHFHIQNNELRKVI